MSPITLYTTSWCGDCRRSKHWLDTNGISYTEINIEEDEKAMQFVQEVNKGMNSVPTIVFPDGSSLTEPSNKDLEDKLRELKMV